MYMLTCIMYVDNYACNNAVCVPYIFIYIHKSHVSWHAPLCFGTLACAQRRGSCCHSDRGGVVCRRVTCIYIDLYSCMHLNIAMRCMTWLYIYMHNTSVIIFVCVCHIDARCHGICCQVGHTRRVGKRAVAIIIWRPCPWSARRWGRA